MRHLILLLLSCALFAVDDSPRIEPTTIDRIQGSADPTTGKIESLEVWDTNVAVDPIGNKSRVGERRTILTRKDAPALFTALDALTAKTSERDAEHKEARKPKPVVEPIKEKVK